MVYAGLIVKLPAAAHVTFLGALLCIATLDACTPRPAAEEKKEPTMSSSLPSATTASAAPPTTKTIALPARAAPATHLLVFLHGVGADAASFQDLAQSLAPATPHADLLVPDGFHAWDGGGTGRQWFSVSGVTDENRPARVREAGADVSRWIDQELARRGLAGDRLAVVGFSQGAILAAWLATHRAPRPAAVVMLSGRVAEDDAPTPGPSTAVFMGHGDRDPIMPIATLEAGARALTARGARVTTRIYPGLAHQVDARELQDVREFLSSELGSGGVSEAPARRDSGPPALPR